MESIAAALGVDGSRLDPSHTGTGRRVHAALPAISAAIAGHEFSLTPPGRPLAQLRDDVDTVVGYRLAAQYGLIATQAPGLLKDALAHLNAASGTHKNTTAHLVVAVARAADAVAYKFGAHDLSARLIDVMRWAAGQADDPDLNASVAYVRAETFLAAHAYQAGRIALELALDSGLAPDNERSTATRGGLHMRTAVVAARAGDADAACDHLHAARVLAEGLSDGTYLGTAFGPSHVRIHELSVSVGLGRDHIGRALDLARAWSPGDEIPAERRSGFWIDAARAPVVVRKPGRSLRVPQGSPQARSTTCPLAPVGARGHRNDSSPETRGRGAIDVVRRMDRRRLTGPQGTQAVSLPALLGPHHLSAHTKQTDGRTRGRRPEHPRDHRRQPRPATR
ncbi:transcriptional regulator [Streptomyces xanthophaeus]|uniref:transcriptional regulator n=1 Tax=Streptomyces xanthophaeus TaxID=67385 RepID=UPI00386B4277